MSENDEVSLLSKRHPARLDARAAAMLVGSPFLLIFGGYQTLWGTGEAASRGPLALAAGVVFLIIGGWWLYGGGSQRGS